MPRYKLGAVKRVQDGRTVAEVARELGLIEQTLRNWVGAARKGKLVVGTAKPVTAEQMELSRLRAENARLKMENEVLKKATAYFAKLRHEVAFIIVSPTHKVGAETGCSVSRSLPVHASPATASCEATGTTRRALRAAPSSARKRRHLPASGWVRCKAE